MPLSPDTTLGPYKIVDELGTGGMGEEYLAEDTRLNRKVAVKVLPAEFATDPGRLARFEQEARAAAALNHPHIAVVHDVGSATIASGDGSAPDADAGSVTHYIVQEYPEGETLRAPLDTGALPLAKALALAGEIGEALTAAHGAGIIHRDLKDERTDRDLYTSGRHSRAFYGGRSQRPRAGYSNLGSNRNGVGGPIVIFTKSGWPGLSRKLYSPGTTTLGTCRTADLCSATH